MKRLYAVLSLIVVFAVLAVPAVAQPKEAKSSTSVGWTWDEGALPPFTPDGWTWDEV
jgi:hypothetical protein